MKTVENSHVKIHIAFHIYLCIKTKSLWFGFLTKKRKRKRKRQILLNTLENKTNHFDRINERPSKKWINKRSKRRKMNPNNRMFIRNIRNIVAIFSIGRIFFTSFQYILMKQEIQINMHSLSLTLTFVLIWNLEAVTWYLRMLFRTLNCHLNVGLNELYEFNTVRSLYNLNAEDSFVYLI